MNGLLAPLYESLPTLESSIWRSPWVADPELTFGWLERFMSAASPTGSVALPGTIIDVLIDAVKEHGLAEHFTADFRSTGNAAVLLGSAKEGVDLLVDAHLDKPSFGIAAVDGTDRRAELFACCANRFPETPYRVAAKVLRFRPETGAVEVAGRGTITSERPPGKPETLLLELDDGDVCYSDMVTLDVRPTRDGAGIRGTGYDDAAGTTILLGVAGILKGLDDELRRRSLNCLFTFSDHEEWRPESFFSHGASRTCFALPPPTVGSIVVDVHTADPGYRVEVGKGLCCGFFSARGRGSVVPLNYQRLTESLVSELNRRRPNLAQLNFGYFSRSDDFALTRWSRMVGLFGVPATDIHRGEEAGHLLDVVGGIVLLSHYIPLVLGLSPEHASAYSLLSVASKQDAVTGEDRRG